VGHIQRRVRNGRVTYRVRYRDPDGRERNRVFTRKGDAEQFLTDTEARLLDDCFRIGSRVSSGDK
jgi:hypothetical protein